MLELIAPAKLNLVLEVMGRRVDGYHQIASVMQTIDLADTVRLEPASAIEIEVTGEVVRGVPLEGPRNLAFGAAHALAETARNPGLGARIELEKRIPAGMGLGGGSTDAAAVLRGLNRLWGLDLAPEALIEVAAGVGSDVAFFLHGGAAAVGGRGEQVEPLPDVEALDLTLFVADVDLEDKTRRMYGELGPIDFTDGHKARVAAESVRRGLALSESDLHNAFDPHVGELAPQVASAMALCREER
ncbi:MAG TPA: 4-(cytidine 5'-diphospho)-2-C-methyl-D-erythritol kinase, partial [Dehalococcoidia bacterium]|nr:4-(cytidine 5'-diphospho)-2-C-methyl-D-erythritol kinase [Dehalococcoidia bacterium]